MLIYSYKNSGLGEKNNRRTIKSNYYTIGNVSIEKQ